MDSDSSPAEGAVRHPRIVGDRIVTILVSGTLIVFALMVGLSSYLIVDISGTQDKSQSDVLTACTLANANRTQDVQIFASILALPAIARPQFITSSAAAAQARELTQVRAKVKVAFALRDCAALYSTGK